MSTAVSMLQDLPISGPADSSSSVDSIEKAEFWPGSYLASIAGLACNAVRRLVKKTRLPQCRYKCLRLES